MLSNAPDLTAFFTQPDFIEAVKRESNARTIRMLEGVSAFQQYHAPKERTPSRSIWQKGNARLLDYGGQQDAPLIFCVPSLINRHYILDLYPERSLVRFLREQGQRVCVLNWDSPGLREQQYRCADYVQYILMDALRFVLGQHRGPVILLGYCMGGIFTLAAAQLLRDQLAGLILLATPWSFSAQHFAKSMDWQRLESQILKERLISPVWTETLFHLLDPWHFQEKFARFNQLSDHEKKHFAAVESWVNDGVPLSRYVAKESFIDWPKHNALASGAWRVGGEAIKPQSVQCPVFIATPMKDRIVPPVSSQPLVSVMSDVQHIAPETGHVSMLVGKHARQALWQPLMRWVHSV